MQIPGAIPRRQLFPAWRTSEFTRLIATEAGDHSVEITSERYDTFITKTPPAAIHLKKAAKIEKASGEPNRVKVARVTMDQVREIAKLKMPDLTASSVEAAMSMVAGTARSMGIDVG